jgi:hypothetical protein
MPSNSQVNPVGIFPGKQKEFATLATEFSISLFVEPTASGNK